MDYLNYWSLLDKPFLSEVVNFFVGEPQREAIAGLSYFATNRLASAVLVGQAGCGMTTLLAHLESMRGFDDCAAEMIITAGNHGTSMLAELALCQALGYRDLDGDLGWRIDAAISATAEQGLQTIWLIDGCSVKTVQLARSLTRKHSTLSVVIGTTTGQYLRQIVEFGRCAMQIDLAPLSIKDLVEYVQFSLEHAGGEAQLFSDNAIVRLHEMSGGVLAELVVLAESSLALAASHRLDQVTPAIIEAVDEQTSCAA
jgi:general secretion pathway protein A